MAVAFCIEDGTESPNRYKQAFSINWVAVGVRFMVDDSLRPIMIKRLLTNVPFMVVPTGISTMLLVVELVDALPSTVGAVTHVDEVMPVTPLV